AAGLDVFAEEPLPPGHPLTRLAKRDPDCARRLGEPRGVAPPRPARPRRATRGPGQPRLAVAHARLEFPKRGLTSESDNPESEPGLTRSAGRRGRGLQAHRGEAPHETGGAAGSGGDHRVRCFFWSSPST